jgi:hypothetical protein
MADTLICRGAFLRYLDLRPNKPAWFCKLHVTADYSTNVAEEMGWGEPAAGTTGADLEGELVAQHIILTPGDPSLVKNEIQLDAELVNDFKFARVQNKESVSEELRFTIQTSTPGAAGIIEDYVRRIGQSATSQLRISYLKQETLPFDDKREQAGKPEEKDTGCVACNNNIPMVDGSDAVHASGAKCTQEKNGGPALIPAREMGGTHQRRKKGDKVIDITPVN